jgi:putative hydrolase of the HAD superfamily
MPPIGAITFDLWDTVLIDDSDEPKRATAGLAPKARARRALVAEALQQHGPIDRRLIDCAYDTADAAFRRVWYGQHVTWSVAERLDVVLSGLDRALPADQRAALIERHERMELEICPDLVAGAGDFIAHQAQRRPLVVISDAIFSPGWALRELLRHHGLEQHFCGFVFSDEFGAAKPQPSLFHRAAELAGVPVEQLLHIGDREAKDVAGARGVGARAVLFTAVRDRSEGRTRADAVCNSYAQLAEILAEIERR